MASAPAFAATPKWGVNSLTAATGATEFGTSAPTNGVTLLTAGSSGSYLRRIKAKNRGTTTPGANILRVFLVVSSAYHPILEIDISSGSTPSASVKSQDTDWVNLDLSVPTGYSVYITQTVANSIVVHCEYADY